MTPARLFALALGLTATIAPQAVAQSSASYTMRESVLNAGGRPVDGTVASSARFRVTLDAIGDTLSGPVLSSSSYRIVGGFAGPHRPPGEVHGVTGLADKQTFQWSWEAASTAFNVYRDRLLIFPVSFGTCQANRVTTNSWIDTSVPVAGGGWFYLVTGEDDLREEGTLGAEGNGIERPNTAPCP